MKYWKNNNVVHDSPTCFTTDKPGSRPMVEVTDEQLAAMLLLHGSIRSCKICTVGLPKVKRRREDCPRCGRSIAVSAWRHNTPDGEDCHGPNQYWAHPRSRQPDYEYNDQLPSDPAEWLASMGGHDELA